MGRAVFGGLHVLVNNAVSTAMSRLGFASAVEMETAE
jgi:hypothetical protein